MWGSRASWVDGNIRIYLSDLYSRFSDVKPSDTDEVFDKYPTQGIEQWHKANGLYID